MKLALNRRAMFWLTCCCSFFMALWGCSIAKVPDEIPSRDFGDYRGAVHAISFAPDESAIATSHFPQHEYDARVHYIAQPCGNVRIWKHPNHPALDDDWFEYGLIANIKPGWLPIASFDLDGRILTNAFTEFFESDASGAKLRKFPISRPHVVDAQRRRVACLTDDDEPARVVVRSFDGEDLAPPLECPDPTDMRGHPPQLLRSFSSDGRWLITTTMNEVLIWDWANMKLQARFHAEFMWPSLIGGVFAPDGHTIAVAHSLEEVRLYDIGTSQLRGAFRHPQARLHNMSFSPDGKLLAACGEGEDKLGGGLWLWRVSDQQLIRSIRRSDVWGITALEFAPTSPILVVGDCEGEIRQYALSDLVHSTARAN